MVHVIGCPPFSVRIYIALFAKSVEVVYVTLQTKVDVVSLLTPKPVVFRVSCLESGFNGFAEFGVIRGGCNNDIYVECFFNKLVSVVNSVAYRVTGLFLNQTSSEAVGFGAGCRRKRKGYFGSFEIKSFELFDVVVAGIYGGYCAAVVFFLFLCILTYLSFFADGG